MVSLLNGSETGDQSSAVTVAPFTVKDVLTAIANAANSSENASGSSEVGSTTTSSGVWPSTTWTGASGSTGSGSDATGGGSAVGDSSAWTRVADLIRVLNQESPPTGAGVDQAMPSDFAALGQPTLLVLPLDPLVVSDVDPATDANPTNSDTGNAPEMAAASIRTGTTSSGASPAPYMGSAGYPAPTPIGLAGDLTVSASGNEQIAGTLSGSDRMDTIAIPISPTSPNIMLMLRSTGGKTADGMPVFTEISLVDSQGRPINGSGTPWMPQPDNHLDDAMINVQQAPAGSELLVQVAPSEGSSASVGTATSAMSSSAISAPGWTMPFVMDVMRQSAQTSAVLSAVLTTGSLGITALSSTSGNPFGLSITTNETVSAADESAPETSTDLVTTSNAVATAAPSDLNAVEADGGNVRVPTGPLVSRNSSPLGPALASLLSDESPAADRHERATLNELGLDLEPRPRDQPTTAGWPSDFDGHETVAINAGMDADRGREALVGGRLYARMPDAGLDDGGLSVLAALMASRADQSGGEVGVELGEAQVVQAALSDERVIGSGTARGSRRASPLVGTFGLVLVVGLSSGSMLPVLFPRIRGMVPRLPARRSRS